MKMCAYIHSSLAFLAIAATMLSPPTALADNEVEVLEQLVESYPDWIPRGIVDVGANKGGWTTAVQSEVFPGKHVPTFMVEASPQHEQELESVKSKFPNIDYKITVLSGIDGDTVKFFGRGKTGDSMFCEQSHHYDNIKSDTRTTSKLDTLVGHMEHIDYLKIDVQGAELMVLQGATETLKRVTFVQMEASVVEYNRGGACWFDLDAFMRHHGFYFYDLADYFYNPNAFHSKGIGQFDVLYVRPTSSNMPKWLQDANVSFCGSNREDKDVTERKTQTDGKVPLQDSAATASRFLTMETSNDVLGFFATFLVGYLAGMARQRIRSKTHVGKSS